MRIPKSATLITGLAIAASMTTGPASAAVAGPPDSNDLRIVEVGTDAMGADNFKNRNREFVRFQNVSGGAVDIANVLVEDGWAHAKTKNDQAHTCNTYKITDLPDNAGTEIANGEYVTVFNGARWGGNRKVGSDYQLFANSDVDCGTEGQFYNNDNDTAYVTDADGDVLVSYTWDHNGGYVFKPQS